MNFAMSTLVPLLLVLRLASGGDSMQEESVLDHEATLSDGSVVVLDEEYAGKVVLVVNTASRCGFTRQYKGLQALFESHKDDGLVVLAFPCNDFGGQEPGSIEEIVQFCSANYGVTFPVFEKVAVVGDDAHPLFTELRSLPKPIGGEPKWNFTKYLINRDGTVAARFEPQIEPDAAELTEAVTTALAAPTLDQDG